ncbi:hypothetical protein C8P64_2257 [Christiangramia gaetbulicola]|uniref:Probable inorganic carbon transporter subunit DabA n=1 Tax=Christiangramia gaetbulicola TaxID=703340 RepID=A0A2T6AIS0_9FLAO|nr:DUF2309 domain-containing protein [Christiangramia gaetbulicola]PTX43725.1 hypothetical protein C8P64_2257 [Christiangramia gaetbulicola]
MSPENYLKQINEASRVIGKTWPLYSFVTSNPLSGYEASGFAEALQEAEKLLGANVFPEASLYRQAWNNGDIDRNILKQELEARRISESPELCLQLFDSEDLQEEENEFQELDRIMAKWMGSFMDEGMAEWPMPNRELGFYKAWRKLAKYDDDFKVDKNSKIPETSEEAISIVLKGLSEEDLLKTFIHHLAALPGWTGYINYRIASGSFWQEKYPISLQDYLGVRLWLAKLLKLPVIPIEKRSGKDNRITRIQLCWLRAWEKSWQQKLIGSLQESASNQENSEKKLPDAQMVFCIDTRSELIRRHVEASGNYETFGYAGFFGIAMDYVGVKDGLARKSCPPIVNSAYKVSEIPQAQKEESMQKLQKDNQVFAFSSYFLKRMKHMLPSAFGYVEGTGILYAASLLARTLTPGFLYKEKKKNENLHEHFCETDLQRIYSDTELSEIELQEKVTIVKGGFDMMGWKDFSPLVIFTGHGSHTANNAFGSSLDCGACAASPGRNNARMLAKLANMKEVREVLRTEHDIKIPENTVFVGAEHNTTTDEIVLFDSQVPESHQELLTELKKDLEKAQITATRDRLKFEGDGKALAERKANNWSDTRPEWGLAKNAGFIVGPRSLTEKTNLDSRCFLHSYDWKQDAEGKALETIMQGPMVVTQWINNHYYFSSVDNETFGGGNKITHNITGRFGVVQGNGGDLKMGLPLQSLRQTDTEMYHQPLRLSVMINAPVARISEILSRNENLKMLLDNEWIYLLAMDPLQGNKVKRYKKNMNWEEVMDNELIVSKKPESKVLELVDPA